MRTLVNPVVKHFIEKLVLSKAFVEQNKNQNEDDAYVVVAISPKMFATFSAYLKFKNDLVSTLQENSQDDTSSSTSRSDDGKKQDDIKGSTFENKNQNAKDLLSNNPFANPEFQPLPEENKVDKESLQTDTPNIKPQEQTTQETSTQSTEPKEKLSFLQQMKLHAERSNILKRAERVFPTSYLYESFKARVDSAYNQNDLKDVKFAISAFENLKGLNSSPIYSQAVDNVSKSPQFSQFVDMLSSMSSLYQQNPVFTGTKEFQKSVEEESISQNEVNTNHIIEKVSQEVKTPTPLNTAGMTIIHKNDVEENTGFTVVSKDAARYVSKDAVKAVENAQSTLASAPQESITQEDANKVEDIISSIETLPSQDVEAPSGSTGEVEKADNPTSTSDSQASETIEQAQKQLEDEMRREELMALQSAAEAQEQ